MPRCCFLHCTSKKGLVQRSDGVRAQDWRHGNGYKGFFLFPCWYRELNDARDNKERVEICSLGRLAHRLFRAPIQAMGMIIEFGQAIPKRTGSFRRELFSTSSSALPLPLPSSFILASFLSTSSLRFVRPRSYNTKHCSIQYLTTSSSNNHSSGCPTLSFLVSTHSPFQN